MGTRSGGCVTKDTIVFPKGEALNGITIEELRSRKLALLNIIGNKDRNGQTRLEMVKGDPKPLRGLNGYKGYPLFIYSFTPDPIVEITFRISKDFLTEPIGENNTEPAILKTTLNHPFKLIRSGYIPAGLLRKQEDRIHGFTDTNAPANFLISALHHALIWNVKTGAEEEVYGIILGDKVIVDKFSDSIIDSVNDHFDSNVTYARAKTDIQSLLSEDGISEDQKSYLIEMRFRELFYLLLNRIGNYLQRISGLNDDKYGLSLEDHFFYTNKVLSGDFLVQMELEEQIRKLELQNLDSTMF